VRSSALKPNPRRLFKTSRTRSRRLRGLRQKHRSLSSRERTPPILTLLKRLVSKKLISWWLWLLPRSPKRSLPKKKEEKPAEKV